MIECKLKNGQTLYIRLAKKEDAAEINHYYCQVGGETDNLTIGENGFGITVEQEEALIEANNQADNQLMLCAILDGKLIAHLGFSGGSRPRIRHTGEFGISVLREYWGLGVGTTLIEALLEWARDSHIIRKINLKVRNDNQPAINLYKKSGFVEEGLITRDGCINDQFYDCIIMGQEIDPLVEGGEPSAAAKERFK